MADLREPTGAARLHVTEAGACVEVDGVIDAANAAYVGALVRLGAAKASVVDLDLRDVPFISAAGITALLACGARIRLCNPSPLTCRVLTVVDLIERFDVAGEAEDTAA